MAENVEDAFRSVYQTPTINSNMGDSSATARKLLDPSELGTKEYWEKCYTRELQNHNEDPEDEGINWFEESHAEDVVLKLLSTYDLTSGGHLDRETTRFLDLGTGNGHMLFALREDENAHGERWVGEMLGVDYSETSVQLARQIDAQRREDLDHDEVEEEEYANVEFKQWDLLTEKPEGDWLRDGFEVVLDKGTFDAISLMPRTSSRNPCEMYRQKVVELIKPGHYLFITSCNWTKDELVSWLVMEDGGLRYCDEAKYPTFKFGGKTGQSVVTVVFKRDDLWTGIVRSEIATVDSDVGEVSGSDSE